MMRSNRSGLFLAAGIAAIIAGCSSSPAPTAAAPTISTQPAAMTVVSGAPATFTVAATGNGTLSYQWRKDGSVLAGSSAASLALSAVSAADAGVYDCILTNTLNSTS